MTYNANNPKDVKEAEEKARRKREQELKDVRALLKTPEGVRYFKGLFKRASLFSTTFTGNSWSYFNEGKRSFGLEILADVVQAIPEKVLELMVPEKEEEEEAEDAGS